MGSRTEKIQKAQKQNSPLKASFVLFIFFVIDIVL